MLRRAPHAPQLPEITLVLCRVAVLYETKPRLVSLTGAASEHHPAADAVIANGLFVVPTSSDGYGVRSTEYYTEYSV